MIRAKALAYLINFYSMGAVAGYECVVNLSHADFQDYVVASKVISATDSEMRSGKAGELMLEIGDEGEQNSLEINAFISGWSGEEEALLSIERKTESEVKIISGKISVRGNKSQVVWFDSYKVKVDCGINAKDPKALG